jgi:hypothetical protein
MMKNRKQVLSTLTAVLSAVVLMGVAGCSPEGVSAPIGGTTLSNGDVGNPPGTPGDVLAGQGANPLRTPGSGDLTGAAPMGNPNGGAGLPGAVNPPTGATNVPGWPPPPGATPQAGLPPEVGAFRPVDGGEVCATPQVALVVHLNDAMRKAGSFDPATVVLAVDGKNVTQDAQFLGTMTFPQSQVSLTYTPKVALSLGAHQVSFTYPGARGPSTLAWSFTVVAGSCPVGITTR